MAERRTTVTYQQGEAIVWPVSWSAIWVGGLAALAAGLIFGLAGTALGAYSGTRIVSWQSLELLPSYVLALNFCLPAFLLFCPAAVQLIFDITSVVSFCEDT